eukprot:scaffold36059_cov78-Phaeocystis_antarctica.AAC.1
MCSARAVCAVHVPCMCSACAVHGPYVKCAKVRGREGERARGRERVVRGGVRCACIDVSCAAC